ncbi:MAG: hypothetical protein H5T84_11235, partial [Thermoleophilia bacterium]|nr:hypothetical protein [Thermoleophilia bacterium]
SKAVSLVDFPVHLPPDGWRLERVTVTPDFRPILSGSTAATPNSVQMTLSGPNGVRVVMTVSRTFLTPVPYFESLAAFQKSLSQSDDSPISDFEQGELDGMVTQMWTFQTKTWDSRTPQTMPLPVLYVYPHWGSVEVSPVPDQSGEVNEVVLKAMLVELARSWLASPIVNPSS